MRSKICLLWLNAAHVADKVFERCKFVLLFFSDSGSSESRERLKGKNYGMVCFAIHHYEICSSFAHLERLNFSTSVYGD